MLHDILVIVLVIVPAWRKSEVDFCRAGDRGVVSGRPVDTVPRLTADDGPLTAGGVASCRLLRGGPKCRRLSIAAIARFFIQDLLAMLRWFYVFAHLLVEAGAARRDARIRFLKAQVEILRRKLGGNRVIPSPEDRARLLAIGQELNHNVADVIGIVTPQTYCRWVEELRTGRKPKRVGRPKRPGRRDPARRRAAPSMHAGGLTRPTIPTSGVVPTNAARRLALRSCGKKLCAGGLPSQSTPDPLGPPSQLTLSPAAQTGSDGIFGVHRLPEALQSHQSAQFGSAGLFRPLKHRWRAAKSTRSTSPS